MANTKTATVPVTVPGRLITVSVGKKIVMAVTGVILIGFITGHMIGNLQLFLGQEKLNIYANALQGLGGILWLVRVFMLVTLFFHVWTAIKLTLENWSARPVNYVRKDYREATLSSRTMIWTGIGVFLFVTYHLLHFTFIVTNPQYAHLTDPMGRHDVYSMVVLGFQNYLISGVYIVAIALLSYHLVHAVKSMFQSVGWNNASTEPILHRIAIIYAWLVFLGYVSMPIGVLLGVIKLPAGVI